LPDAAARHVLITRPEPGASATAHRVAMMGYVPIVAPMLRIVASGAFPPLSAQAIIITSANAVPALNRQTRATPVFAVGDATADAARKAGFAATISAGRDAEALAALIQTSLRPQDGPLLLASGARQGRELAAQLRISGFRLMRRIAYAARPQKTLPAAARLALLQGQVCAVLVFSAETGQAFGRAFAQAKELSPALLAGVEALVISHTARFPLFHLPWRQIRVASFPNQDQLVGLLP